MHADGVEEGDEVLACADDVCRCDTAGRGLDGGGGGVGLVGGGGAGGLRFDGGGEADAQAFGCFGDFEL